MKPLSVLIATSLTLFLVMSAAFTAQAAGQPADLVTPTPGPDGRILWIVQEGQTCTQIANLAGITLSQLRGLNNLADDCPLTIGQTLVIGTGGPGGVEPTSGPAPSATPAPATPTPVPGSVDVCVLLYNDQNGDALHQDAEPGIAGGAISISGSSGQYSKTAATTAGTDPLCFEKVPIGIYTISVAAPSGYNPTTLLNYTLEVKQGDVKTGEFQAGDRIYVDFGAQESGQSSADPGSGQTGGEDNLAAGIIGAVLLLAGGGLAIYAWRYARKPTMPR